MIGKLIATIKRDLKLSLNGLYFYIELGLAIIFIMIMVFVVPENFDRTQDFGVVLESSNTALEGIAKELSFDQGSINMFENDIALIDYMKSNNSAVGIVLKENQGVFSFEVLTRGFEDSTFQNIISAGIKGMALERMGIDDRVEITYLNPGVGRLSDRNKILPVYFTMNIALMGLFIIAAYIFLDKDEGVIKAHGVAPVPLWIYLASKIAIMGITGILTTLIVSLALLGTSVNYLLLIGLVISFNFFGSALGLFVSSFFDTMVKAMGAMYGVIMLLMIASISYFLPAFSPQWIKILPSYPMLFSFRELLVANGDIRYVLMNMLVFMVLGTVIFYFANVRFKRTLTN